MMGRVWDVGASISKTVLSCPERTCTISNNTKWSTCLHVCFNVTRLQHLLGSRRIADWCNVRSRESAPPRCCLWSVVHVHDCSWPHAARRQSWGSDRWTSAWLWHWEASGRSAERCVSRHHLTLCRKTGREPQDDMFKLKESFHGQIQWRHNGNKSLCVGGCVGMCGRACTRVCVNFDKYRSTNSILYSNFQQSQVIFQSSGWRNLTAASFCLQEQISVFNPQTFWLYCYLSKRNWWPVFCFLR